MELELQPLNLPSDNNERPVVIAGPARLRPRNK